MAWQPQADGLAKVLQLIRDSAHGSNEVQKRIFEELAALQGHPEFNNYLAFILANASSGEAPEIRQRAGLMLKNNCQENWGDMHSVVRDYVKAAALETFADANPFIRQTVGTLITTIAAHRTDSSELGAELVAWPQLLPRLIGTLDAQGVPPEAIDGALNALSKLCEDLPEQLDSEQLGRPLNALLPALLKYFRSEHEPFRRYALGSMNQFLPTMPHALNVLLEQFLQGLFALASSDPSKEVRKRVCQAFVMLLHVRFHVLVPFMKDIIRFMLFCTQQDDEALALEACEFWSTYCEADGADLELLRAALPELVPVLMRGMVYSEMDLAMLSSGGADEDNQHVPDAAHQIRPAHYHGRVMGGGDDDDDDEDESATEWSLRKCSAASLDSLSVAYGAPLLEFVLPELDRRLADLAAPWPQRESGILALGAIAEGCAAGLAAHLPRLVPYLIQLTRDAAPLIRSITCWTLSRFAQWAVEIAPQASPADPDVFLRPMLEALLQRVLDRNKKVQEAACSACSSVSETAGARLVPYTEGVVGGIVSAFGVYQAKNTLMLFDLIGAVCDSVGDALAQPQLVAALMPPLLARFRAHADDDRNLWPVFECMGLVASSLRQAFLPYAQEVFFRCVTVCGHFFQCEQQAAAARDDDERPNHGFLVCALDLMSSTAEAIGASVESLVSQSNALALLYQAAIHDSPDARQSAFALLGDLAKLCIGHVRPHIDKFMPLAIVNLRTEHAALCTNASWSLGELAIKIGPDALRPFAPAIVDAAMNIFHDNDSAAADTALLENIAITIGRIALVCPDCVGPRLETFGPPWCYYLRHLHEDGEKMHAFHGLCLAVHANPRGILPCFRLLCEALASWQAPPPELGAMFRSLLTGFKSSLGAQWSTFFEPCEDETKARLRQMYGV